MKATEQEAVLTIEDLSIDYQGEKTVHAVKNVTLSLARGEILGLAGRAAVAKPRWLTE